MSLIKINYLKPFPCSPDNSSAILNKINNDYIVKTFGTTVSAHSLKYSNINEKIKNPEVRSEIFDIFKGCLIEPLLYKHSSPPFMLEEILIGYRLYTGYLRNGVVSKLLIPHGAIDPYTLLRFIDRGVIIGKDTKKCLDDSIDLLISLLPGSPTKVIESESERGYWKNSIKRLNHIISVNSSPENDLQNDPQEDPSVWGAYKDFFYNFKLLKGIEAVVKENDDSRKWYSDYKSTDEYTEHIVHTGKDVNRINFDYLLEQFASTNGLVLFSSSRTPEMSPLSYVTRYIIAVLKVYQVPVEQAIAICHDYSQQLHSKVENLSNRQNAELFADKVLSNMYYSFKPVDFNPDAKPLTLGEVASK